MTAATPELDQACRSLAHVLDINPAVLRPDTPLADLGADAVALLSCSQILRREFQVEVDGQTLKQAITVADLAAAIRRVDAAEGSNHGATASNLQA